MRIYTIFEELTAILRLEILVLFSVTQSGKDFNLSINSIQTLEILKVMCI